MSEARTIQTDDGQTGTLDDKGRLVIETPEGGTIDHSSRRVGEGRPARLRRRRRIYLHRQLHTVAPARRL